MAIRFLLISYILILFVCVDYDRFNINHSQLFEYIHVYIYKHPYIYIDSSYSWFMTIRVIMCRMTSDGWSSWNPWQSRKLLSWVPFHKLLPTSGTWETCEQLSYKRILSISVYIIKYTLNKSFSKQEISKWPIEL